METVFSVIILILIFIIVAMIVYHLSYKKEHFTDVVEVRERPVTKQAIVFKTHVWTSDIETHLRKILQAISGKPDYDLWIVFQGESLASVPSDLHDRSVLVTDKSFEKVYEAGFEGKWLGNHWLLMWFFKQHPEYDYYWSIDYDVRIVGNSNVIWSYTGAEDFVTTTQPFRNPTWAYKDNYTGKMFWDESKHYGYLPLARYSKRFLAYLDTEYHLGEHGQDELITYSLFVYGRDTIGLTINWEFLRQFIKDSWSVIGADNSKHVKLYKRLLKDQVEAVTIIHPVKL